MVAGAYTPIFYVMLLDRPDKKKTVKYLKEMKDYTKYNLTP